MNNLVKIRKQSKKDDEAVSTVRNEYFDAQHAYYGEIKHNNDEILDIDLDFNEQELLNKIGNMHIIMQHAWTAKQWGTYEIYVC